MPDDQWDDLDSPITVDAIVEGLKSAGHEAIFLEASVREPYNLAQKLVEYKPDLCFNIAESHWGDGRESHIPSILEMLKIPYTGSKVLSLALALDKAMTKRILKYHHLPTAEFQVFDCADAEIDPNLLNDQGELRFPLFAKPSREGTSMGISTECIVRTVAELRAQVTKQIELYNQPILCEQYISGREINVGMIGNIRHGVHESATFTDLPEGLTFLPPLEVDLKYFSESEADLYTNRIKTEWADQLHIYLCPAPIDDEFKRQLCILAANVFYVLECRDVARVDFRIDAEGNVYILEINPLPGLNPELSDLWLQAKAAGWTHPQLINAIVEAAAERQGLA
jgi:D-alanine-D-alanine ligase